MGKCDGLFNPEIHSSLLQFLLTFLLVADWLVDMTRVRPE